MKQTLIKRLMEKPITIQYGLKTTLGMVFFYNGLNENDLREIVDIALEEAALEVESAGGDNADFHAERVRKMKEVET